MQNCDNLSFLCYVLTFSHFGNREIDNSFEHLGRRGGDDLDVRTLGGGGVSKTYIGVQGRGWVQHR